MRAIANKINVGGVLSYELVDIASYEDYCKHIGAEFFDVVTVEYMGHRLSVFIDDEGMLKPHNVGRMITSYPEPIFGNVIIAGDVDASGNTLPLPDEITLSNILGFSSAVQYIIKG